VWRDPDPTLDAVCAAYDAKFDQIVRRRCGSAGGFARPHGGLAWRHGPIQLDLRRRRGELLDQTRNGRAQLRAHALPVGKAIGGDAKPYFAFGRLGIVETYTLDEAAIARVARVGRHDVEEGTFLGAAPCQSNDNHPQFLVDNFQSRPGPEGLNRVRLQLASAAPNIEDATHGKSLTL
jgi:hypothetical protein